MIKGTCPACGRVFKVEDRYAGQTGRCKSCGAVVTVPGEPDEGLDGLAGAPKSAETAPSTPAAAPQAGPPEAAATPQPAAATPATPGKEGQRGAREGEGEAPAKPSRSPESGSAGASPSLVGPAASSAEPERARAPRVLEDPSLTHDARSRYEPSHGPTAMESAWLKEEPGGGAGGLRAEGSGLRADDVLATKQIVTTVESAPEGRRPVIVTAACVVVALVALGFCARFITAWPVGMVPAAIGLLLAALGIGRLWTGHGDGLIPAALFCLCDIGIVLLIVFSRTTDGQRVGFTPVALVLLGGGALALLFVVAASLANSSRAYFDSRG